VGRGGPWAVGRESLRGRASPRCSCCCGCIWGQRQRSAAGSRQQGSRKLSDNMRLLLEARGGYPGPWYHDVLHRERSGMWHMLRHYLVSILSGACVSVDMRASFCVSFASSDFKLRIRAPFFFLRMGYYFPERIRNIQIKFQISPNCHFHSLNLV
jgi:hypothetical protein